MTSAEVLLPPYARGGEAAGTLGILDLAAKRKLIDLKHAIELLKQTNFRYRKEIIESLLAEHQDRGTGLMPSVFSLLRMATRIVTLNARSTHA